MYGGAVRSVVKAGQMVGINGFFRPAELAHGSDRECILPAHRGIGMPYAPLATASLVVLTAGTAANSKVCEALQEATEVEFHRLDVTAAAAYLLLRSVASPRPQLRVVKTPYPDGPTGSRFSRLEARPYRDTLDHLFGPLHWHKPSFRSEANVMAAS